MTALKKVQCKGCKKFFKDDFASFDTSFEFIQNKEENPNGFCSKCFEEIVVKPIVNDPQGIFFCPTCKVRTSDKNIWTQCSR